MSLDKLVGNTLERIKPDPGSIEKLISAAERNIKDSKVISISTENRFDAAYKAIMQLSKAALHANGYRTLTSSQGHHRTMIQTLSQTVGIDSQRMVVMDRLRQQRNAVDYSGDLVSEAAVEGCIEQAEFLLAFFKQ